MFRRRIFYDASGKVLSCNMAEGALKANYSAQEEAADMGIAGCACMEWMTPDAAVEAAFAEADAEGNPRTVQVSVDVSGTKPQLVFAYAPIGDAEKDDPYEIIDILTGGDA